MPLSPPGAGLFVAAYGKSLMTFECYPDGPADFFITGYDDSAIAFQAAAEGAGEMRRSLSIRLICQAGNPAAAGAKVFLVRADGTQSSAEIHAGSGYLSQSAPVAFFADSDTNKAIEWRVRWPDGERSAQEVSDESVQIIRRDSRLLAE